MMIAGPFEYVSEKKTLSENEGFLYEGAKITPF